MIQEAIDVLLMYDIVEENGTKYLQIPLESILNETVTVGMKYKAQTPIMVMPEPISPCWVPEEEVEDEDIKSVFISKEIKSIYKDDEVCIEKVTDYLNVVADSWEYRNSSFKKSILKKVAGLKPALNGDMFKVYGKEGDEILAELVTNNMNYIKNRWKNGNKD